jgi:hypothetical protein
MEPDLCNIIHSNHCTEAAAICVHSPPPLVQQHATPTPFSSATSIATTNTIDSKRKDRSASPSHNVPTSTNNQSITVSSSSAHAERTLFSAQSFQPFTYTEKNKCFLLSFPIPPLAICPVLHVPVCTSLNAALFWKLAITHEHPNPLAVFQLILHIQKGFPIGITHSSPQPRTTLIKNLPSIVPPLHSWVDAHMQAEVAALRRAGPFQQAPFPNFVLSPIGLVPKRLDPNSFRVIHHLSWPRLRPERSINHHVHPDFVHIQLQSFEEALSNIIELRRSGAQQIFLAKVDIKSAYRLLGVQASDWPLLGMHWKGQLYFDKVLPMGLSSSCKHWERVATLAQWIAKKQINIQRLLHYIDDFLMLATSREEGSRQRDQLVQLFTELGMIVAMEKNEGPAESLVYLGIHIDTASMTIGLDAQRLQAFKDLLSSLLGEAEKLPHTDSANKDAEARFSAPAVSTAQRSARIDRCSLRFLLSLIGKLSWATRVIRAGRTFLRRLINYCARLQSKVKNLECQVAISKECRKDLTWWWCFLQQYDHSQRMPIEEPMSIEAAKLHLFTDASELGAGAVFGDQWWSHCWQSEELLLAQRKKRISMPYLECRSLLLAVSTWCHCFRHQHLVFHIDCQPIESAVLKGDSREQELMQLIRCLSYLAATHQFLYTLVHVPGINNVAADLLSRLKVDEFRQQFPNAQPSATPIVPLPHCPW